MSLSSSSLPVTDDTPGWLAENTTGEMLRAGLFGLEREALRITSSGSLAQTPHPAAFGDKITHPTITVDFSESQVEMVTPPQSSVAAALESLGTIQREVESTLTAQGEALWPLSMPPALPEVSRIPIARFPDTPEGRRRELYRRGLSHRYGYRRQAVSGIHFSFSFGAPLLETLRRDAPSLSPRDHKDAAYFRTARNFLRDRWLLVYLTGASPAVDATFNAELEQQLAMKSACCRRCCAFLDAYRENATSLRVSRFGYADTARLVRPVSFSGLSEHVRDLQSMLQSPSERFAGLHAGENGEPVQLNDRVLQSESEFYSPIRLKGRVRKGESHLAAMLREGVHYAEVRLLDNNPFAPQGIDLETLRFLQVLLLDNLSSDVSGQPAVEGDIVQENHHRVALAGRQPGLTLLTPEGERPLLQLARPIFARLLPLARLMDRGLPHPAYASAVHAAWQKFIDPSLLPSARIHQAMLRRRLSHHAYGVQLLNSASNLSIAA